MSIPLLAMSPFGDIVVNFVLGHAGAGVSAKTPGVKTKPVGWVGRQYLRVKLIMYYLNYLGIAYPNRNSSRHAEIILGYAFFVN